MTCLMEFVALGEECDQILDELVVLVLSVFADDENGVSYVRQSMD